VRTLDKTVVGDQQRGQHGEALASGGDPAMTTRAIRPFDVKMNPQSEEKGAGYDLDYTLSSPS
jgi:hypothetical protein